uniref:Uncharacterized protein n=1 Tax=Micrurus paraensis TaxID=1970185 RepID=A0A2D4KZ92_9SAUR
MSPIRITRANFTGEPCRRQVERNGSICFEKRQASLFSVNQDLLILAILRCVHQPQFSPARTTYRKNVIFFEDGFFHCSMQPVRLYSDLPSKFELIQSLFSIFKIGKGLLDACHLLKHLENMYK